MNKFYPGDIIVGERKLAVIISHFSGGLFGHVLNTGNTTSYRNNTTTINLKFGLW